jgi:hypothetical protein
MQANAVLKRLLKESDRLECPPLALALLRPVSKLFDSLHSGNLAALPLKS